MNNPKTKLWLYVSISACIIFAVWLVTVKYSIKHELGNTGKESLFEDIKISLNKAWQERPQLPAPASLSQGGPTTTDLQGGPKLSQDQFDELIDKLNITLPTSTPTTTDLTVETPIDISDWLTYQNEEYGFEISYPGLLINTQQAGNTTYFYDINHKYTLHIEPIDKKIDPNQINIEGLYGKIDTEQIEKTHIAGVEAYRFMEGDAGCGGHDYRIPHQEHQIRLYFVTCGDQMFDYEQDILSTFKFTQ